VRIAAGGADLLLGCDLVVAASRDALAKLDAARTRAVLNTHETITAEFVAQRDLHFPASGLLEAVSSAIGTERLSTVDATAVATRLLGDSIGANLFMVGYAWQQGLIPLREESILAAIELNAVAVEFNRQAFALGRRAAAEPQSLAPPPVEADQPPRTRTLEETIERRVEFLTGYQNAAYARRYRDAVERVRAAEAQQAAGLTGLTEAVARNYFRLLACKDEYEVARLYSDGTFRKALEARFEGDYRLGVHLAPPLLARRDPATGHLLKREFGPWILRAFAVLAKLRFLRGSAFDPFGRTAERRAERALVAEYEQTLDTLLTGLDHDHHPMAVEIARLPEEIRGFGHIKEAAMREAAERRAALIDAYTRPQRRPSAA